jgi:hypothetical protein
MGLFIDTKDFMEVSFIGNCSSVSLSLLLTLTVEMKYFRK